MRATLHIILGIFSILAVGCSGEVNTPAPETPFSEAVAEYADGNYGAALRLMEPHAVSGNDTAQMVLAEIYLTGKTGIVDEKQGVEWLEKAAGQGNVKAQSMMGTRYLNGAGVEQNDSLAVEYLLAASSEGNARANLQMGLLHEYGREVDKDLDQSAKYYYRAAVIGDEEGITRLTILADMEALGASAYLGLLHLRGHGFSKNPIKAFELAKIDAEGGHSYAQFLISEAYGIGQGVDRNVEKAYMWANLSAAQSFPEAAARRDVWAQVMTPEQIEAAQTLSRNWQADFDAKNP